MTTQNMLQIIIDGQKRLEKDQQEMKQEQQALKETMHKELLEMKQEQQNMRTEQQNMRTEQQTMADMQKAIIANQRANKEELAERITNVEKKVSSEISSIRNDMHQGFKEIHARLDKQGKSLAYLEDDAPTREEFTTLETRVTKIERGVKRTN